MGGERLLPIGRIELPPDIFRGRENFTSARERTRADHLSDPFVRPATAPQLRFGVRANARIHSSCDLVPNRALCRGAVDATSRHAAVRVDIQPNLTRRARWQQLIDEYMSRVRHQLRARK